MSSPPHRPAVAPIVPLAVACASTVLLVPLERFAAGLPVWAIAAVLTARQPDPRVRRNLGLVLACVLVLAFAPIRTDLTPLHFLTLGLPFLVVILGPYLFMRHAAKGELEWRFWKRPVAWRDLIYVAVSIPLAWGLIELYFFHFNPDVATHWRVPSPYDPAVTTRLAVGINAVGFWDEMFFINTVYVLLRGIFPARIANPAQAIIYTSVLYDMAFTGHGVWIVYGFALTQGIMYEKSRALLWVLLVHLIVDLFLVLAILQYHYPGHSLAIF
jgi:hypothetical protein